MIGFVGKVGDSKTAAWRQRGFNDGLVRNRKPRTPLSEPKDCQGAYLAGFRSGRESIERAPSAS